MTIDTHREPRCTACDTTLVRAGATCPTCDHDEHFEGAVRTAPRFVQVTGPGNSSTITTVRP